MRADPPATFAAPAATLDLDRAATTPLDPRVQAVMQAVERETPGNASSRHAGGVAARARLEAARAELARALGAPLEGVVFTGGGTEANNLGVLGAARAQRRHGQHVLVGAGEHPSVAAAAEALAREGFELERIPLAAGGVVDLDAFAERLRPDTVLVAQMLVSNLLGTVAPVARMARLTRARAPHARVHVDAVQAIGKLPVALDELAVDSLALSAHKLYGPKGVGVLVHDPAARLEPLLHGGGQEHGLRPGTEAVALCAGAAAAVARAGAEHATTALHLEAVRAALSAAVDEVPGARLLEPSDARLRVPSILAVLLPGPPAEVWLHHLEEAGVWTSAGSACQSRARRVPPALTALGLAPDEARRVLRLSASRTTTLDEAREAGRRLVAVAARLEGLGLLRGGAGARA